MFFYAIKTEISKENQAIEIYKLTFTQEKIQKMHSSLEENTADNIHLKMLQCDLKMKQSSHFPILFK